jgi:hypothetical protein
MGFLRRSRDTPEPAQAPLPVIDLARAAPVIEGLSRTMAASDAEVRAAVFNLLDISGTPTDPDVRIKRMVADASVIKRPWRWLAAAATKAASSGEHVTAGQALVFTFHFTKNLAPRMNVGDFLELGLDPAPAPQRAEIVRAGLAAGNALPDSFVIVGDHTGSITADTLLKMAAYEIGQLEQAGVAVLS